MFEALDELGVRPAAIAGSSTGALAGVVYGTGVNGAEIRNYDRSGTLSRIPARLDRRPFGI